MAEGGEKLSWIQTEDLSRTLAGGHDEVFEWVCNQCEDDGKNTEAIAYCQDCGRAYCSECIKLHARFPLMQKHTVLGQFQIQDWGGKASMVTCIAPECPDHKGECVTMFCENHDDVCCPVCIELNHRNCKKKHYIPMVSKSIASTPEFTKTVADVDDTLSTLYKVNSEKKKNRLALDESKKIFVERVKQLKQKIVETADRIETHTMKEMTRVQKAIDSKLQEELDVVSDLLLEFEKLRRELKTPGTDNSSQQFVTMKCAQKRIASPAATFQTFKEVDKYTFSLQPTPELVQLIEDVTTFGTVATNVPLVSRYVVRNAKRHDVSWKKDSGNCFITGMCQLPNGELVFSDYNNKKLKLFERGTYSILSSCDMLDKPRGITPVNNTEVAVVLKSRRVQFVSIEGGTLHAKRSFATGYSCYGIAHHGGRLFVSKMENEVVVFDLTGYELFTISGLLEQPRHVAAENGGLIHVADLHKGVVTIDKDGKHLYTRTDQRLKDAFGICIDNYGNVLLSCYGPCNVMSAGNTPKSEIVTLLGVNEKLACPLAICFDQYRGSLLVSNNPKDGCNHFTVFDLEIQ